MTFLAAEIKQKTGALVVATRPVSEDRRFFPNPPDDRRIAPGDVLIAIGSPEQLSRFAVMLNPA